MVPLCGNTVEGQPKRLRLPRTERGHIQINGLKICAVRPHHTQGNFFWSLSHLAHRIFEDNFYDNVLGINTDSLAIPDAADFAKSVEAGFSEVLALGA